MESYICKEYGRGENTVLLSLLMEFMGGDLLYRFLMGALCRTDGKAFHEINLKALGESMFIREYQESDCKELAEFFYNTVHTVNAKDYTKEQLDAWATGQMDLKRWNQLLREHYSIVAVGKGQIVGFGYIDETGYLDHLFIHADYQRKGIATAICNELERAVDVDRITTCASITAKPFFESRGYKTVREQQAVRGEVSLTNYLMEKNS